MNRTTKPIAISLLLGLALSVLSGWIPALFTDLNRFTGMSTQPVKSLVYPAYVPNRWGPPDEVWRYPSTGPGYDMAGWTQIARPRADGSPTIGLGLWFHRFGWPMRSMQHQELTLGDGPDMPAGADRAALLDEFRSRAGWRTGLELPTWLPLPTTPPRARILPLTPAWAGMAGDTALYGAAAWIVLYGPGILRRRARAKRGACTECGYPRGMGTVCPECGCGVTLAGVGKQDGAAR